MLVGFQMDPLENLNLSGDTTFLLALEAQRRNFKVFHYTPNELVYENNEIYAYVRQLNLDISDGKEKFEYLKKKYIKLNELDIILMRQDPPFNLNYITATHLLEKIKKNTIVINDPFEVRNAPEKIFVTCFSEIMPKTLITRDINAISRFRNAVKSIILKPLYGNGGEGIFYISEKDTNFNSIIEILFSKYNEQIIAQEYLPEVRSGDKRIILIDGKVEGAINRVPAKHESRSNMHVGGKAEKTSLTSQDLEICKKISPFLKQRKLFFVGIDVIGNYITEINVTSPTGIREINYFNNIKIEEIFWDKLLKKIS